MTSAPVQLACGLDGVVGEDTERTEPDGVACYVDSGNHVGLGGKPFWFANALVVYNMNPNETRFDLHV